MTALVVFYSRTGTTRVVAERVARALGADLEELVDPTDRRGWRGYLRSGFDARLDRWVPIAPVEHDPARYEHGRTAPAIAAFVTSPRGEDEAVAAYV